MSKAKAMVSAVGASVDDAEANFYEALQILLTLSA